MADFEKKVLGGTRGIARTHRISATIFDQKTKTFKIFLKKFLLLVNIFPKILLFHQLFLNFTRIFEKF